jgi:hypothetical protein
MLTIKLDEGYVSPDVNPCLLNISLWRTSIKAPEGW